MNKDTAPHTNIPREENLSSTTSKEEHLSSTTPLSPGITFTSSHPQQCLNSSQKYKRKTEAQKLQQDIIEKLNLDSNILHSGSRLLRSKKTLYLSDEDRIRQEVEKNRLFDQEITLRPLRPGQGLQNERFCPKREDFEYIYRHIDELDCQVWATNLEPWLHFITQHSLYPDPSIPILDKDGKEYPDLQFSLDNLLCIPANKKYLKKNRKKTTHDSKTTSLSDTNPDQDSPHATPANPSSSSSSSGSFAVLPHQSEIDTTTQTNPNTHILLPTDYPPGTGATPTQSPTATPSGTPPSTPEVSRHPTPTSDLDSDSDMSLKERSVFFPPDKFDGKNKALTKQHWQIFEDFCNQQKLYIEDVTEGDDVTRAAPIEHILPFFKMTLIKLARAWADRQTFRTAKDLKDKFLTDFSPYGKTHRQWISS